jgi:hypothetical protein
VSVPVHEGGRFWYRKNDGLQRQAPVYSRDTLAAPPVLVLDPNQLSPDGSQSLAQTVPSPDGQYLAYSLAEGGSDWETIHIRDVEDYSWDQLIYEYHVSTLTMVMGGIVRAVKFITPAAYDHMLHDQKQRDLMRLGDLASKRTITRALHWYRTPRLRKQFFSMADR